MLINTIRIECYPNGYKVGDDTHSPKTLYIAENAVEALEMFISETFPNGYTLAE